MPSWLLIAVAVLCSFASVYLFASDGYRIVGYWVATLSKGEGERYQSWIDELGATDRKLRTLSRARSWVPVIAVALFVVSGSLVFALVMSLAAYAAPWVMYRVKCEHRMKKMEGQLPDAIDVMVASVRAGRSLATAVEDVEKSMSNPIAHEFGIIATEHKERGVSIEHAIDRARRRISAENFTMVATALIVNAGQGGDLLSILERVSEATRELYRLQKKIETETSEIRAQEKVVLLLTPLFLGLVLTFDPSIPEILFHSVIGNVLLVFVVILQVAGFLWIRRIVKTTV